VRRTRRPWTPFERRQRASARVALYGSLVVVGAVLAAGLAFLHEIQPPRAEGLDWLGVDYAAMPEVQLLQGYLQVDTSQPRADEEAGARYLAARLAEGGVQPHLELLGHHHANLWAILEGEDPRALVLHSHIDTDPVPHPERWTYPPFSGHVQLPYLYGRGAYDMKSIGIAQLAAFLDLAHSGRRPARSVIFLATGSEEVGSDLGTKRILRAHPELVSRFWAFLTEGGVVESVTSTEVKYWGIEFAQKRYVDVLLCGGERQRLDELRKEILGEQGESDFQVRLAPEVAAFLKQYAPTRDRADLRRLLADPLALRRDGVGFFDLPLFLRGLFRDEAVPFPVTQEPGGDWEMVVKFHLVPGSDFAAARRRLLPPWRTAGLAETVYDEGGADHGSPLDHPVFAALVAALRQAHPDTPVGPYFLHWAATDSRFVRAAGIPAYGFEPFLVYTADTWGIGRADERIQLPAFVAGVRLYRRLVAGLAG
jgi:acetylornithine deacetylase/succinyl-diaminopimelate desuccinylase-like protein